MKVPKSIRTLNWIFFWFILVLNTALVIIALLFLHQNNILFFITLISNIIWIIVIGVLFFINYQYVWNFESILGNFQKALGVQSFVKIPGINNIFFVENKKLEWLFKNILLKNNLLYKDYSDLKDVFTKFVPQKLYKEIWYKWYERILLGSCVAKKLTIMFLDIVWFTHLSESMSPERTLLLLNIYFDGIVEIIHQHGWYIDKFLWDGIMFIFDHEFSDSAVACAIEIINFMNRFNISELGQKISIGIGINSGDVIIGTIGTKKRLDATVIWDNVNIAARLQSLTRKYKKSIIVSQNTIDILKDKQKFSLSLIGSEILLGKERTVDIWNIDETDVSKKIHKE